MTPRKKLVRKDVIRLARQKLWTDIGKALDSYEKHVYGELALGSRRALEPKKWICLQCIVSVPHTHNIDGTITRIGQDDEWLLGQHADLLDKQPESREGDISSVEEIEKILPPEPPKRRARPHVRRTPVSEHIRGEKSVAEQIGEMRGEMKLGLPERTRHPDGLSASEENVLILIVQSAGGMTPAQLAIKVALKKRTIQNVLTMLKGIGFIIKDANHGKFRATEEGREAVKGRYAKLERGAILNELSESERKVLFAIASKKEGVTLSAISVMVPGIKKRTKQNILTALKTRELIEKSGDRFALTEYAREELKGKLEKQLTGKALREKLLESLPEPQAAVLDWLSYDGGRTATAEELAGSLGYATRTVQNIFTALKAQEFITKHDGRFQLSSHLKD